MAAVAHVSPTDFVGQRKSHLALVPLAGAGPRSRAAAFRRRRIVALIVVVAFSAALVLAGGRVLATFGSPAAPAQAPPASAAAVYVVQPGDTFWAIARRLDPNGDPRPLVARLVAAHGSPRLVAGERLTLPAGA